MSIDAINTINKAEETSKQTKLRARQDAKKRLEDAEREGNALVAERIAAAESVASDMKRDAAMKTATARTALMSSAEADLAQFCSQAESKLSDAAQLIVERIADIHVHS